jgi:hypothetical protein
MAVVSNSIRPPRWYLIPIRVLLVTFVVTLLSFAISLFLGILGTLLGAKLRGVHANLTIAYRHVAVPAGAIACAIVMVSASIMEIRHYRRLKALRRLEEQLERAN